MENVLQYLKWRGDILFQEKEFNEVDALVCSLIAYIEWEKVVDDKTITLYNACQKYLDIHTEEDMSLTYAYSPMLIDLIKQLPQTARYKDIQLKRYISIFDEDKEAQFAAITILLPNHKVFISFRGTDSSILGWKEDFEMTYQEKIPSHQIAVDYLKQTYQDIVEDKKMIGIKYGKTISDLYLGGHSKGGNLAMYAAICCEDMQTYIKHVYSFDGPGFRNEFYQNHDYSSIIKRIYNYVPISSIIGRLMTHKEKYIIFNGYDNGLQQHDSFYWKVCCDHFDYTDKFDDESNKTMDYIDTILLAKSDDEKKTFITLMFKILNDLNINNITDFAELTIKQSIHGIKELSTMTTEDRKLFLEFLKLAFMQVKSVYFTKKKENP
ncbi:MAG: Mbeg1-like protein [Coprobacillus sp.]